jgi:hypothetical protein
MKTEPASRLACFRVAAVVALILLIASVAGAGKFKSHDRLAFTGKVTTGRPIEIGIDHGGVKLEAITFSENEALVIIWNRTPGKVNVNAGLALFDRTGQLMAAESDDRPITRSVLSIRAGKQANLKIKLKKFLSDVGEAAQFQLVVTIVESEG